LNHRGIEIREGEIFFLCDGLNYRYHASGVISPKDIFDFIKIDYRRQLETFGSNTGAGLTFDLALGDLAPYIRNGRLVMAFLKESCLEHHVLENPNENLGGHGVVVNGIDLRKETVTFLDPYILTRDNQIKAMECEMEIQRFQAGLISLCHLDTEGFSTEGFHRSKIAGEYCRRFIFEKSQGYDALAKTMKNLEILKEMEKQDRMRNIYAFILLLKAYFYTTVDYICEFAGKMRSSARVNVTKGHIVRPYERTEESKINAKKDILKKHWEAVFLRMLSSSEYNSPSAVDKLVSDCGNIVGEQRDFVQFAWSLL